MEFLIKFSKKPMNPKRRMAIEIARKCNATFEDGYYLVRFHEINQNLRDLLRLTSGWSTSEFIVEGHTGDISEIRRVVYCERREICNGVCLFGHDYYLNLDRIIQNCKKYETLESDSRLWRVDNEYLVHHFIKFNDAKTRAILNKEVIIAHLKKELQAPLKYCDMITEEKISEKINALPESFILTPYRDCSITQKETNLGFDDEEFDDEYSNDGEEFKGLTEYQKAKLEAMAKVIAPIFAQAFMEELKGVIMACTEELTKNGEDQPE
jgi:hypothetical protein